jgi:hypothetical protein
MRFHLNRFLFVFFKLSGRHYGSHICASICLLSLLGCVVPPAELTLVKTQIQMSLSDETIKSEVQSYVLATFFSESGPNCTDFLEMSPSELYETKIAQQPLAASQALCPQELTSSVSCPESGETNSHLLADLYAPGRYSVLLLGSRLPYADASTYFQVSPDTNEKLDPLKVLADHSPSVVAIGCRELEISVYERRNIELILFPSGLR